MTADALKIVCENVIQYDIIRSMDEASMNYYSHNMEINALETLALTRTSRGDALISRHAINKDAAINCTQAEKAPNHPAPKVCNMGVATKILSRRLAQMRFLGRPDKVKKLVDRDTIQSILTN